MSMFLPAAVNIQKKSTKYVLETGSLDTRKFHLITLRKNMLSEDIEDPSLIQVSEFLRASHPKRQTCRKLLFTSRRNLI